MSMALQWSSWYAGVVRGRGRRDAVMTTQNCRGGGVVEQGRRASCRFWHLLGRLSRGGGRVGTTLSLGVRASAAPHLLYMVPARQGPTTQLGWVPRPGSLVKGPTRSLEINTNSRMTSGLASVVSCLTRSPKSIRMGSAISVLRNSLGTTNALARVYSCGVGR